MPPKKQIMTEAEVGQLLLNLIEAEETRNRAAISLETQQELQQAGVGLNTEGKLMGPRRQMMKMKIRAKK